QIQVFNGHNDWVYAVEYSPFVINDCNNLNVIYSGSEDNTIRFWDIRSNKNELHMIKGDDKEDNGIYCLKFIRLKTKENINNVTYDLNLCYGSKKEPKITVCSGNNENNHNNGDNTNVFIYTNSKATLINACNEFKLLDLHQEITELNVKLPRKHVEMETLQHENKKWQNAHDFICNAASKSQKEIGLVKFEIDDAKLFYKKELTKLRSIIQYNKIELSQYEKQVEELEEMYL
ncbi:WD40 repeat-containing protein, partial [Reticulomyxa filosa]